MEIPIMTRLCRWMMSRGRVAAILAVLSGITYCGAAEYHVSVSGDDSDPGTSTQPWRTLTHAAGQVSPGDDVIVHAGVYYERLDLKTPGISGTAGNYITFRAEPAREAIIDGSDFQFDEAYPALVDLSNCSFVRIEGFIVRDYTTDVPDETPMGIWMGGSGEGVEIVGNLVENITSTAPVDGDLLGRDAHGIAVYGNATTPISNLLIRDNELRNLTLGSSEALVLNGNVDGFRVLDNHVHHCDNIGIDAIGFEGTGPTGSDQARNGVIAGNHVHDITSDNNPAYWNDEDNKYDTSAGGIYVDGGKDIIVERNHVHHCDIGIEVASEHKDRVTSNITVRSNLIRENLLAGLFIGGYNDDATGDAKHCAIIGNTFFNNDTDTHPDSDGWGQIYIQYHVTDTVIANNILYHDIAKWDDWAKEFRLNYFIVAQWYDTDSGMTFDHNLYYGPDTPVWVIKDEWREGWSAYEADAASGSNEAWGDPQFANTANPEELDFTPVEGSPAVDSGDPDPFPDPNPNPEVLALGERDFNGNLRLHGAGPDRGAIEPGAPAPVAPELTPSLQAGGFRVEWTAAEGVFTELLESKDLVNWRTVPGYDSLSWTGSPFSYDYPLSSTTERAFFKVETF